MSLLKLHTMLGHRLTCGVMVLCYGLAGAQQVTHCYTDEWNLFQQYAFR